MHSPLVVKVATLTNLDFFWLSYKKETRQIRETGNQVGVALN